MSRGACARGMWSVQQLLGLLLLASSQGRGGVPGWVCGMIFQRVQEPLGASRMRPPPSEAQVLEAVRLQKLGRAADEFGVCADVMRAAARPGS